MSSVYGFLILGIDAAPTTGGGSGTTTTTSASLKRAPPAPSQLPSLLSSSFDKELAAVEAASAGDDLSITNILNRVWLARFYTAEGNNDQTLPRREAVAARIREEYRVQTLSAPASKANDDTYTQLARGVFEVASNRLFATPKIVVWQQFMKCAYAVILDADEQCNVLLATSFLSSFISATVEHFGNYGVFESPVQFYQRPEDMFVLLHKFLPQGHMWYTRGRLLRKLVDEAKAALQVQTSTPHAKPAFI